MKNNTFYLTFESKVNEYSYLFTDFTAKHTIIIQDNTKIATIKNSLVSKKINIFLGLTISCVFISYIISVNGNGYPRNNCLLQALQSLHKAAYVYYQQKVSAFDFQRI